MVQLPGGVMTPRACLLLVSETTFSETGREVAPYTHCPVSYAAGFPPFPMTTLDPHP